MIEMLKCKCRVKKNGIENKLKKTEVITLEKKFTKDRIQWRSTFLMK